MLYYFLSFIVEERK